MRYLRRVSDEAKFGPSSRALSERARELRERKGLAQQAVGERLGLAGAVARQRVYKFESTYQLGTPDFIAALAEQGLEVPTADLWLPVGSPQLEDLLLALLELRTLAGAEGDAVLRSHGVKVGWLREMLKKSE